MAEKIRSAPMRIELTREQREQLQAALRRGVAVLELAVEELEDRTAPSSLATSGALGGESAPTR